MLIVLMLRLMPMLMMKRWYADHSDSDDADVDADAAEDDADADDYDDKDIFFLKSHSTSSHFRDSNSRVQFHFVV